VPFREERRGIPRVQGFELFQNLTENRTRFPRVTLGRQDNPALVDLEKFDDDGPTTNFRTPRAEVRFGSL
jgi:hypothetical protein